MNVLLRRRRLLWERLNPVVLRTWLRRKGWANLAVVGIGFCWALPLSAFFEVARGELILNTTLQATYDSNIFARNDAQNDLYFSLIPELQFLRQAGRGTIDSRLGVDITRFMDFSSEDYEDFYAALDVSYPITPTSPLSGSFYTSFVERTDVHDFINTRVSSEVFTIGAQTIYLFSDRLGLRNRLEYVDTDVEEFSDIETYSGTFGLHWVYSDKLAYFGDYRLRRSRSSGEDTVAGREVNNLDHAFFLGAVGVLRPRLDGTVSIGYQHTDARGTEPDTGLLVTAVALDWAWRPRTSLTLAASRDIDVSPTDETVETSDVLFGVNHEVDAKISLTGHLGYRNREFRTSDRRDNAFLTGAGIDWMFTRYWNAGFNYNFIYNDSNVEQTNYRRQIARIFTRYSF